MWPAATENLALSATRQITFYPTGFSFVLDPELSLILVVMICGIIGACAFSLYAISDHLKDEDFNRKYESWYITRPIVGAGLALLFYFLLRGGVLTIGADLKNMNLLGVAAISGLVGMFSEQAMIKLRDVARPLFGTR